MTNKKTQALLLNIDEMEVVNFCRILGRYGVKFEISELRNVIRPKDVTKKRYFRVFTVHGTKKQMDELCKELGVE